MKRQLDRLSGPAREQAMRNLAAQPASSLPRLQLQPDGTIMPVDPPGPWIAPRTLPTNGACGPIASLTNTFLLHSRVGSTHKLYLDFDGHTTTNTEFNWSITTNLPIVSAPFDPAGDGPGFSSGEKLTMQYIWQRISEDFSPFDIDVTTEEPSPEEMRKASSGDETYGLRVVISPTWEWFGVAGGYAYVGSFNWGNDTPCFVFSTFLYSTKQWAECCSHETGHTLGLYEDGSSTEWYYDGHASLTGGWAPIMGNAYSQPLSQWCHGEYLDANNTEDDLSIISSMAGRADDDHVGTVADATALTVSNDTSVSGHGVIERSDDVDMFYFECGSGTVHLAFHPSDAGESPDSGANLDILAVLYDGDGGAICSCDVTTQKYAVIDRELPRGKYCVSVQGTGSGTPMTNPPSGYTAYGSLGRYTIAGTIIQYQLMTPAADNDGGAATLPGLRRGATLRGTLRASSADFCLYWGLADGGTNKEAWEAVIPMGLRSEGAQSADVVGLTYGRRYYYRCYASNAIGVSWAPETSDFVLQRPREPLLPVTNGILLWLDASQAGEFTNGQQVGTWPDISGRGNHAARHGNSTEGYPRYATNEVGGLPAVRFNEDGTSWFSFNNTTNIRTVFWVLKESTPGPHFLLGDDNAYHFHRDSSTNHYLWDSTYAASGVRNGATRLMGSPVNGRTTKLGSGYRLVSLVTSARTEASRICDDRGYTGRSWDGGIAEILIYTRALTSNEENRVGGYLAVKYGLAAAYVYTNVPSWGITNLAASLVTATSATLRATLKGTSSWFSVSVYWGAADGQTNEAAWSNSASVGSYTNVGSSNLSLRVAGLASNTVYYYRFRATNCAEDLWAMPPIVFSYPAITNIITATAGQGGSISPSGMVQVALGGSRAFSITADDGWQTEDVLVDGVSAGPRASYAFTCVVSNHTISAVFGQNPDVDSDGMPDAWEMFYFDGTNAPGGGSAEDGDSDGFANLSEYIAGTDPTNGTDSLRVHIMRINNAVSVDLATIRADPAYGAASRYYSLEYLTNLAEAWVDVNGFTNILGTNQVVVYTNSIEAPSVFYRGKAWLQAP